MKFTLLFLVLTSVQVFATAYSQNTKLSLNLQQATLSQVFEEIESQSEFRFLYNDDLLKDKMFNKVQCDKKSVEEILDELLEGTESTYSVMGNNLIVITPVNRIGQQAGRVSGTIRSADGMLLPGVTVVIKGTTNGTVSDADGKYSLNNIPANATLLFSFVGMKMQEIVVAGREQIDVVMEDETIGL